MPRLAPLTPRRPSRVMVCAVLGIIAMAGVAGCQSSGGSSDSGVTADGYTAAFSAGRYDEAYRLAEPAASTGDASERERAALIAGMSASAMGKREVAARWLTPLISSSDRYIAGKAYWTLGTIADSQKRTLDAAKYYSEAGERLDGDDGAKACTLAGDAYSKLKLADQASAQYQLASQKVQGGGGAVADGSSSGDGTSSTPTHMVAGSDGKSGGMCSVVNVVPAKGGNALSGSTTVVNPASLTGRYVIQLCALAKQDSAEAQAKKAKSAAAKAGTPTPKVVPATDTSGRTLYAVRIGPYPSRDIASADLKKLGINGVVMAERN